MAGKGTVTIGGDTQPFASGDALPVRIGETKSFENTGTEPMELMVIGVAKDMDAKNALTMSPAGARGALAGARAGGAGGRAGGGAGGRAGGGAGRGAGRGN
jgi:hypothetical protein